jgi:hypothetical protein
MSGNNMSEVSSTEGQGVVVTSPQGGDSQKSPDVSQQAWKDAEKFGKTVETGSAVASAEAGAAADDAARLGKVVETGNPLSGAEAREAWDTADRLGKPMELDPKDNGDLLKRMENDKLPAGTSETGTVIPADKPVEAVAQTVEATNPAGKTEEIKPPPTVVDAAKKAATASSPQPQTGEKTATPASGEQKAQTATAEEMIAQAEKELADKLKDIPPEDIAKVTRNFYEGKLGYKVKTGGILLDTDIITNEQGNVVKKINPFLFGKRENLTNDFLKSEFVRAEREKITSQQAPETTIPKESENTPGSPDSSSQGAPVVSELKPAEAKTPEQAFESAKDAYNHKLHEDNSYVKADEETMKAYFDYRGAFKTSKETNSGLTEEQFRAGEGKNLYEKLENLKNVQNSIVEKFKNGEGKDVDDNLKSAYNAMMAAGVGRPAGVPSSPLSEDDERIAEIDAAIQKAKDRGDTEYDTPAWERRGMGAAGSTGQAEDINSAVPLQSPNTTSQGAPEGAEAKDKESLEAAWTEADNKWKEALSKDPLYVEADKNWEESSDAYEIALTESKLQIEVFDLTPEGVALVAKQKELLDIRRKFEENLRATPEGKNLWEVRVKANEALDELEEKNENLVLAGSTNPSSSSPSTISTAEKLESVVATSASEAPKVADSTKAQNWANKAAAVKGWGDKDMDEAVETFRVMKGYKQPEPASSSSENLLKTNVGLTQEAKDLLETVNKGGVPAYVTNNFSRILKENGISQEDIDKNTPQDLVGILKNRAILVS